MPKFEVFRTAKRIALERQRVEIEADSPEVAVRRSKRLNHIEWEIEEPLEDFVDDTYQYEAKPLVSGDIDG